MDNSASILVSRNFDVNGYWGLGLIVSGMLGAGVTTVDVFIYQTSDILDHSIKSSINHIYLDQLRKAKFNWLHGEEEFRISTKFEFDGKYHSPTNRYGLRVSSIAEYLDCRITCFKTNLMVWPNNPQSEMRSLRKA